MKHIASAVAFLALISPAAAEPAVGVTPNVLGRATFDAFNLQSDPRAMELSAQAKRPVDIVVRTHDYAPGSSTGWHSHPGPVFITITEGQVTFYERDDPTCTPKVVSKGQGYVDTGKGHIGRNESGAPAKDVTVIFAPVGQSFRGELDAPAPQCKF
ncbi:MAG: cupin domain-containing protein [Pseudomonadota bacterium]|nr:cupin domain-containing protein [Pseudomonadota bacterium]